MRIGVVDLDTSHPENWIPIERDLGHTVAGVWDGGAVHPAGYAESFAQKLGIARVYPSIEAMVPEVDCAIIHGCNWDTHVEKARPFVEAGKAVLLDKPMTGNLRDIEQIKAWARAGARIGGGSSLRFCRETRDWLARPLEERGEAHTAVCGCAVDEFNYGIHAYAMLCGILGPGIRSVRHLSAGAQRRIEVAWSDGRVGLLIVGKTDAWLPFYATVVTGKSVTQYQADAAALYRGLLEVTLPYLAGDAETPPVSVDDLLEAELCALAARRSWLDDDREVTLSELSSDDSGYDGAAFAVEYRKMRYGS